MKTWKSTLDWAQIPALVLILLALHYPPPQKDSDQGDFCSWNITDIIQNAEYVGLLVFLSEVCNEMDPHLAEMNWSDDEFEEMGTETDWSNIISFPKD